MKYVWLAVLLCACAALPGCASSGANGGLAAPTPVPLSGQGGGAPEAPAESGIKALVIFETVWNMLQGKPVEPARALLDQMKAQAAPLAASGNGLFFDFGDPNLPLNRFAADVARTLLALSPLYVLAYLGLLLWDLWKEKPIPNPIVYVGLVLSVMFFLAAFAVITQGMTRLGTALASALAGQGLNGDGSPGMLDMLIGVLDSMQRSAGWLAFPSLFIAVLEFGIILIQLVYRGISMAIWRFVGVILIPFSVLVEGVQFKTAGRVIGGFFEAWLDIVGKISLLLIVLALASAPAYANIAHLILPAGLLAVVFSWKFIGLLFIMLRDAAAKNWQALVPAEAVAVEPLSAAAERARSNEIDQERRQRLKEE